MGRRTCDQPQDPSPCASISFAGRTSGLSESGRNEGQGNPKSPNWISSWDERVHCEELVGRVLFMQRYDGKFQDAVVIEYVAVKNTYKLVLQGETSVVEMPLAPYTWFLYPREKLAQETSFLPRGTIIAIQSVIEGSYWGVVCSFKPEERELTVARADLNKIYILTMTEY